MTLKKIFKTSVFYIYYKMILSIYNSYIRIGRFSEYAFRDKNTIVNPPCFFDPSLVELFEQTRISTRLRLMSYRGKFIVKKYSVIAADCTVITQNHKSTVSIPQIWLGVNHINDVEKDIIIEEDVWVGYGVTMLYGTHLGRGCICAARSLTNKEYPPYSVLAGIPARIVAVKFSKEQILQHEKYLYTEKERFTEEFLDDLFNTYFKGLKVYGTDFISESDKNRIKKFKQKQGYNYIV